MPIDTDRHSMRTIIFASLLIASIGASASVDRDVTSTFFAEPDSVPALNQKVIEFVKANMSKKVGRGECWDLAANALEHAGAQWDGSYGFGSPVDPVKDQVFPGDIVQFENVVTQDRSGNVKREEKMPKHTAIIYRVVQPGVYDIAHQNTDVTGRKVGTSRFVLDHVVRGKVMIYRPVQ